MTKVLNLSSEEFLLLRIIAGATGHAMASSHLLVWKCPKFQRRDMVTAGRLAPFEVKGSHGYTITGMSKVLNLSSEELLLLRINSWRDWTRYGLSLNSHRKQVRYCAPHAGYIETTSEDDCYPPGFALCLNCTCFGSHRTVSPELSLDSLESTLLWETLLW